MKKEIIKLPNNFMGTGEVKHFKFNKIGSWSGHYCYQVTINDTKYHYEVFKPKISPICIDFEKRIYSDTHFKEVYPRSNQFGVSAWTFTDCEKALNKLNSFKYEPNRNKNKN